MPKIRPPQPKRRVGLARGPGTPSLLTVIRNRPRDMTLPPDDGLPVDRLPDESDDELIDSEPLSTRSLEEPAISSGKQPTPREEGSQTVPFSRPKSESDEDQNQRRSRAEMTRPYFGTSRAGQERAKACSASQDRNPEQKRYQISRESNVSTCGSKRSSPDDGSPSPVSKKKMALARRLEDEKEARRLQKPKRSYSQKDKKDTKLSTKSLGKPTGKRSLEETAFNRKKEGRSTSPKRPLPSFKAYDDDPFDQFPNKASPNGLIELPSLPSSPIGSPSKATFLNHSSLSPGVSPRRAFKAELMHPSGSLPEPLQSPQRKKSGLRDLEPNPNRFAGKNEKEKTSFLDLSDDSDSDFDTSYLIQQVETRCPMCNEIVDKALLERFSDGARLHIRKQIQFCRLHKKKSAEDAWDARGYPTIDWDSLGARLTAHYDFLQDIMNGGSSHYASLLVDKVKEGKNRTLLKAEDSLTPGYYGPRGLRAFSENIIGYFSSVLRERAVEDRLISSRGYSGYVEAVLVPELAVQLISEDMKVEIGEARTILEESRWIGDLLHEDIGDTVDQLSDDERIQQH